MAIEGIGMRSSFIGNALLNVRDQLEEMQRQLGTGKKSETYAGLGTERSFAIGLRTQLSNLASYKDTITNVNTRLSVGNSVLERLIAIGATIKTSASGSSTQLENSGQTMSQVRARDSLAEMLQLLNIQSGDRYLFSGRATDTKAVADIGDILEGSGAQAGLKQVIAERKQADVGATGLGRLVFTAPPPDADDGGVVGRGRSLAVRLEAERDHVVADRRDGRRARRARRLPSASTFRSIRIPATR